MAPKRDKNGKFIKGSSGNPGGKHREAFAVKEFLKAHTVAAAEKLVWLMENADSQRIQKECAESVLDRVCGKPTQTIAAAEGQEELQMPVIVYSVLPPGSKPPDAEQLNGVH